MGQKSKKQARKSSAASRAAVRRAAVTVERATDAPAVKSASVGLKPSGPEFNPDYSQTIKDLKRIGILAGGFFSILIILAFFLR
jgi:hypothetical protein